MLSVVALASILVLAGCNTKNTSSSSAVSSSSPKISSSTTTTVAVTGVTLDKTTAELVVGGTVTLTATVAPTTATDKTVTWASSDATVASVAAGVVTAVKAGTANITATADGKSATCAVTVRELTPAERHADYIENNGDKTAKITIQGKVVHIVSYADSKTCNIAVQEGIYGYWINNAPQTVVLGNSYVFSGVGAGKSYPAMNLSSGTVTPLTTAVEADPLIIGTTASFDDSGDALFTVPEGGVAVTEIVKDGANVTGLKFAIGTNNYMIGYNTNVSQATDIGTKFASAGIGTKITALKAIWHYNKSAEYPYETYQLCSASDITFADADPVSVSITAANAATSVQIGSTLQLSAEVNPSGAAQDVTWSSGDISKATIDANGLVTPVAEGEVVITATSTVNNAIKGTFTLTVAPAPVAPVTSITVTASGDATGAKIGETLQLTAAVAPSNAPQNVTWKTSNEKIATVEDGLVTFVADGAVTITATASDSTGVNGTINLNTVVENLKTYTEVETIVDALSADSKASETLSFRGVITAKASGKNNFLVNDSLGGLEIYGNDGYDGMKVGDTVLLVGTFTKYKGLVETKSVTITKSYVTVTGYPTEATSMSATEFDTFATAGGYVAGKYIKLSNASISNSNLDVGGTSTAVVNAYAVDGYSLPDEGVYGTVTGWVEKISNSKYVNLWIDSFTVNPSVDPDTISISSSFDSLTAGSTLQMAAKLSNSTNTYANITDSSVTWSVANKSGTGDALASIDANGLLTAGANTGVVTVTATSKAVNTVISTKDITIKEGLSANAVTISTDALGLKSSAYTEFATKTINNVDISAIGVGNFGSVLQYRLNTSTGNSEIYNTSAMAANIKTITVTLTTGKPMTKNLMTVSAGTASIANAVAADVVTADSSKLIYTFSYTSDQAFTYFNIGHSSTSGTFYVDNIVVDTY